MASLDETYAAAVAGIPNPHHRDQINHARMLCEYAGNGYLIGRNNEFSEVLGASELTKLCALSLSAVISAISPDSPKNCLLVYSGKSALARLQQDGMKHLESFYAAALIVGLILLEPYEEYSLGEAGEEELAALQRFFEGFKAP